MSEEDKENMSNDSVKTQNTEQGDVEVIFKVHKFSKQEQFEEHSTTEEKE